MAEILVSLIRHQLLVSPLYFHGGLSQEQREKVLDEFEKNPTAQILILSLKAGGVGLVVLSRLSFSSLASLQQR